MIERNELIEEEGNDEGERYRRSFSMLALDHIPI